MPSGVSQGSEAAPPRRPEGAASAKGTLEKSGMIVMAFEADALAE
jgi:hypothetical protein